MKPDAMAPNPKIIPQFMKKLTLQSGPTAAPLNACYGAMFLQASVKFLPRDKLIRFRDGRASVTVKPLITSPLLTSSVPRLFHVRILSKEKTRSTKSHSMRSTQPGGHFQHHGQLPTSRVEGPAISM